MALSRFGRRTSSRKAGSGLSGSDGAPYIGLIASQARAVDAGLLTGTDTDGHAVFYVADGIGLGVFQGDEGDDQSR